MREERYQDIVDTYYALLMYLFLRLLTLLCSETEKYRDKEKQAAINIQKNWRMLKVKWGYQTKLNSCRFVQRVYRGFKGRAIYNRRCEHENMTKQMKFFHEMAKIV